MLEDNKGGLVSAFGDAVSGICGSFLDGISTALEALKEPLEAFRHSKHDGPL